MPQPLKEVLRWVGAIALWIVFIPLLLFGSQLQGLYFLILAVCGFFFLMFRRTGRLKWMLIGLLAGIYLSRAHSYNAWIFACIALFLLFLHDERIRVSLIEKAKDEARDDFIPKPWFRRGGLTEEEAVFGPQRPPLLSEEQEQAMEHVARHIGDKL